MEITGRLTADAETRKTKNNKEVVGFTVVVNDYYKSKDGEKKEFSEFINCSYWLSSKIADTLLKGTIVTISGRIYLNEFKGKDGEHHAYLAFHVNYIKIIATVKKNSAVKKGVEPAIAGSHETKDDLPF